MGGWLCLMLGGEMSGWVGVWDCGCECGFTVRDFCSILFLHGTMCHVPVPQQFRSHFAPKSPSSVKFLRHCRAPRGKWASK